MVLLEYFTALLYILFIIFAVLLVIVLAIPVGIVVGGYFLFFRRQKA